jgi:hypothetical protein
VRALDRRDQKPYKKGSGGEAGEERAAKSFSAQSWRKVGALVASSADLRRGRRQGGEIQQAKADPLDKA